MVCPGPPPPGGRNSLTAPPTRACLFAFLGNAARWAKVGIGPCWREPLYDGLACVTSTKAGYARFTQPHAVALNALNDAEAILWRLT